LKFKIYFSFYWRVKLKRKINLIKREKKIKKWGWKLEKKDIKIKFEMKGEIEKKNKYFKKNKI